MATKADFIFLGFPNSAQRSGICKDDSFLCLPIKNINLEGSAQLNTDSPLMLKIITLGCSDLFILWKPHFKIHIRFKMSGKFNLLSWCYFDVKDKHMVSVFKSPVLLDTCSFGKLWRRELPTFIALIFSCSWDFLSWWREKHVKKLKIMRKRALFHFVILFLYFKQKDYAHCKYNINCFEKETWKTYFMKR